MICKTLKQELSHVLEKLESVAHCMGHGGYNHEVVCHVPALVEIAQNYAIMLSDLDSHGIERQCIDTLSGDYRFIQHAQDVVDLPSMEDVREVLNHKWEVVK